MKAGFIGLGTMGASMAANLQKGIQKDGHTVLVHDIHKEAAAPHIKNGAIWADSPAAIAAECDIIFTSLPGPVGIRRGLATARTGCCRPSARTRLISI